ncbi:MAG: class I SAM-dependent methyltransferase [Vicinamibacterales bacterium]
MAKDRARARELQDEFFGRGDALGWFDALYRDAKGDTDLIPWADLTSDPLLEDWRRRTAFAVRGRSCLVVGCGLGDDAEALAADGGDVTAFDLSPTAIDWCRRRFPDSVVQYRVADLFQLPPAWRRSFAFVFECNTLQALPAAIRPRAIECVADLVAPGGTLLVICRARDPREPADGPPWPLTRDEVESFARCGMARASFDDVLAGDDPPARRFVASFTRGVSRSV